MTHRIVIVGGGAAGLALASKLGRKLRRDKAFEVVLVDAHLTHIWKPLLHEVAAGTFDAHVNEVSYLAQAKRNGFIFRLAELTQVNRQARTLTLGPVPADDGTLLGTERELSYDTLVLAVGSVSNDYGVDGVAEHCHYIDSTAQAQLFQRHLMRICLNRQIQNDSDQSPTEPVEPLNISIVGAGATGVELAAQLHEIWHLLHSFGLDRIHSNDIRISLIEGAPRILPALPEYLSEATTKQLERLGIDVLVDQQVASVRENQITTASGLTINADIKVWAAGVKAPDVLNKLDGLSVNRINQVIVYPTLQSQDDERIFAIGDCAECDRPGFDSKVPPRAQAAHQQANTTYKNILAQIKNKPLKHFTYRDHGSLVSLGKYSTVGNIMGNVLGTVRIEGLLARWTYLSLYKMHQVALFGFFRTTMLTVSNVFRRSVHPTIKLH